MNELIDKIFAIKNNNDFNDLSLKIYDYQKNNCEIYRDFLIQTKNFDKKIGKYEEIPFLPISFFKTHKVYSSNLEHDIIFKSSGTSQSIRSQHFVKDLTLYEQSFINTFNKFFSDYKDYSFLLLLPSYIENGDSSLAYMCDYFRDNTVDSHHYLYDYELLYNKIVQFENSKKKYLLFGVSYALLEFAHKYNVNIQYGIIVETGGMKGKRKEMIRQELHSILKKAFNTNIIMSEYGMTELLSQSYYINGEFKSPSWKKVLIRDPYDFFEVHNHENKRGLINIVDLANLYSCSFIATDDVGIINSSGGFDILGRFDNTDIRGCNLLVM